MGAKPRSPQTLPGESPDKLGKRVLRLMRGGKFEKVIDATNDLFSTYATAIGAEDPFSGSPIKGLIGYCLNFRSLAFQELGKLDDAVASLRSPLRRATTMRRGSISLSFSATIGRPTRKLVSSPAGR